MRRGVCLSGRGVVVCWRALFVFVQVPDFGATFVLYLHGISWSWLWISGRSRCSGRKQYDTTPLGLDGGPCLSGNQALQVNAAVDAANAGGQTPIHWAAWNGHAAVAELLLQANASPTAVDKYGRTPADLATHGGHAERA